jgi:hypothetical protein
MKAAALVLILVGCLGLIAAIVAIPWAGDIGRITTLFMPGMICLGAGLALNQYRTPRGGG